jgi:hypothetical protein
MMPTPLSIATKIYGNSTQLTWHSTLFRSLLSRAYVIIDSSHKFSVQDLLRSYCNSGNALSLEFLQILPRRRLQFLLSKSRISKKADNSANGVKYPNSVPKNHVRSLDRWKNQELAPCKRVPVDRQEDFESYYEHLIRSRGISEDFNHTCVQGPHQGFCAFFQKYSYFNIGSGP